MTQYTALESRPWATITGRLSSNLLHVLPTRVSRGTEASKIGIDFQPNLRFAEDEPYTFLFCDVASQELWMSALLGGIYNNHQLDDDPFWNAMLHGDKSNGTDLYSLVANSIGLKRNQAKAAVLASLYGCGLALFKQSLLKSIPDAASKANAEANAKVAYEKMKGKKRGDLYEGGVASNFFNWSQQQANLAYPKLPIFNQKYPSVLCAGTQIDVSHTGSVNYAVQAGCATPGLLSILLSLMSPMLQDRTKARFSGSVHDCYLFIVRTDFVTEFAQGFIQSYYNTFHLAMTAMGYDPSQVPDKFGYDAVIDESKAYRKYAGSVYESYKVIGRQHRLNPGTGDYEVLTNPKDFIS
jgi:hypothetical protein